MLLSSCLTNSGCCLLIEKNIVKQLRTQKVLKDIDRSLLKRMETGTLIMSIKPSRNTDYLNSLVRLSYSFLSLYSMSKIHKITSDHLL